MLEVLIEDILHLQVLSFSWLCWVLRFQCYKIRKHPEKNPKAWKRIIHQPSSIKSRTAWLKFVHSPPPGYGGQGFHCQTGCKKALRRGQDETTEIDEGQEDGSQTFPEVRWFRCGFEWFGCRCQLWERIGIWDAILARWYERKQLVTCSDSRVVSRSNSIHFFTITCQFHPGGCSRRCE